MPRISLTSDETFEIGKSLAHRGERTESKRDALQKRVGPRHIDFRCYIRCDVIQNGGQSGV